jgi:crotonobetainyl-CoA:carnitine CoA-transferase CaiB-like acyl-CoA transferase
MHLVGRGDLVETPWFANGSERAAHDEIDTAVADWVAERTRAEVIDAFTTAEAGIAPVYDLADLMDDEHVQAREVFVDVPHPVLGAVRQPNVLFRMSETPGAIRHAGRALGEDTDAILAELGFGADDIARLKERGAVAE